MTTDPSLELLKTVIETIRTDPDVVALFQALGRPVAVWSNPPTEDTDGAPSDGYPMIYFPSMQMVPDGEPIEGADLRTGEPIIDDQTEALVDVHSASRQRDQEGGLPEAIALMGAMRGPLARALTLAGFRVTLGHLRDSRHFTESDGLTGHAVGSFRYLIQPA